MKKILLGAISSVALSSAALAADLPARTYTKAPTVVDAAMSWTGFYIGANGGYGWSNNGTVVFTANDPAAFSGTCGGVGGGTCIPNQSFRTSGALAGGQLGYNWQVSATWVLGIEADIDWANLKGSGRSSFFHLGSTEDTTANASETVTSFGTVRGRVGFLPTSPLMIFGTGGLAYGTVKSSLLVPNNIPIGTGGSGNVGGFSYTCSAGGPACFAGNSSTTKVGWTVGAGAEYLITNNWSVKAEYLYAALGRLNGTATTSVALAGTTASSFNANYGSVNLNIVRVGLNYKFGGPVVAKY